MKKKSPDCFLMQPEYRGLQAGSNRRVVFGQAKSKSRAFSRCAAHLAGSVVEFKPFLIYAGTQGQNMLRQYGLQNFILLSQVEYLFDRNRFL